MLNKCQSCGKRTTQEKFCHSCKPKEKSKEGLNESFINQVLPKDYEKLKILQNEAIIGLLSHIASTSGGGLVGTAISQAYIKMYNDEVKKLVNNKF